MNELRAGKDVEAVHRSKEKLQKEPQPSFSDLSQHETYPQGLSHTYCWARVSDSTGVRGPENLDFQKVSGDAVPAGPTTQNQCVPETCAVEMEPFEEVSLHLTALLLDLTQAFASWEGKQSPGPPYFSS